MTLKFVTELPDFETATSAWSRVAKLFINDVEEGFEHIVLEGNNCYRANVHNALKQEGTIGISGLSVGHGNVCVTTVQNYDIDFSCYDDANKLLKGKMFNKCSCLVGKGLLPNMVQYGLGAGCGEITEYWIYVTWHPDPRQDTTFYFVDANYEFDRELMRGKTAKEAYDAMIQKYYQYANYWQSRLPDLAHYLRYDADNRKLFGDPNFKLPTQPPPSPPPPPPPPPPPQPGKEYSGTHTDEVRAVVSGTLEGKLFGIIPITLRLDGLAASGKAEGELKGKVGEGVVVRAGTVTIVYQFISSSDPYPRWCGRMIDAELNDDFWNSQPEAKLGTAQHLLTKTEQVTLEPGEHYVMVSTSGYYPEWTVSVWVNDQKLGDAYVGRGHPAKFTFTVVGESGKFKGKHGGRGELKLGGECRGWAWLTSRLAIGFFMKVKEGSIRIEHEGTHEGEVKL